MSIPPLPTPAPGDAAMPIQNLTYDELALGQADTIVRTLSLADIHAFALVSGDVNPAHVDHEYAESTRFQGVIAHGMWAGALISSLLGTRFPGPGTIYIEQSLRFTRPVHVGDTLIVRCTVAQKDDATRNVTLDCQVENQRGETVVQGQALVRAPHRKVSRPRVPLPAMHLFDPNARLEHWMKSLKLASPVECAVVHPCDPLSLRAVVEAAARGLIVPRLIGPASRMRAIADAEGLRLDDLHIDDVAHSHAAAAHAAQLAANGAVAMLAKGSLQPDELIAAIAAQPALRTERAMSHIYRFEIPAYPKPVLVTDAAFNIAPDLVTKADIVQNAIDVARALGIELPRVALLSAVETVTARIPSTLDAAALCKMADRGQIRGALLDGPLAFDNAISAQAARLKGIDSPVAGAVDILVAPDIEAGNMLARQLEYLAGAASCAIMAGARVPIAMSGRAEGLGSRVASIALAAHLVAGQPAAVPSAIAP